MIGRKSALWLAAAISVLTLASASQANAVEPCNGAVELCSKTLDQVVLPGTHNSMSNEEYGWAIPNQHYSIPTQLDMGIRAFLFDTHYGKPSPGTGASDVADWKNGTDGDPVGTAETYLCHEYCTLGASDLTTEFGKVAAFLASHPREVLVTVNEDYIAPSDYAKAVTDSGLIDYVYMGSTDSYPTLEQMIDSNQRVVMLAEGHYGADSLYDSVPWYHLAYDGAMQETPYEFHKTEAGDPLNNTQAIDQLTNPATLDSTCRPNRGGTTGDLFLMNHWVNGYMDNSNQTVPDPEVAKILNQRDVLVNRAKACEARRGKLPNIVAVDDFGEGDLITAVRELNGLTKPELSLKRPSKRTVKAGRKATFAVTVTNSGEEDATAAKLCVTVPARLAVKPGCRTFALAQGKSKTIKLTLKTRRKAKGSGKIAFKVSGWGAVASTSTTLKVKPLKKKKPKRNKHSRH